MIAKHRNFPLSMSEIGLSHYHNSYEIFYLKEGDRYYYINDKCYHVTAGNMVFIDVYDVHYTAPYEQKEYERYVINFKKELISDITATLNTNLYGCFNKSVHVVSFNEEERIQVEYILESLYKRYLDEKENHTDNIKIELVHLLALLNNKSCTLPVKNIEYINPKHELITQITDYINNNLHEDITLQSISEKFFISTYYFSRLFKKYMGINFIDYLNNIRVREAQLQLTITDLNITQISDKVGFKSPTHFGRIFKKITGVSPMTFKNNKRKEMNS